MKKIYWTTGLGWAKLLLEKRTIFGLNNIAYMKNENGVLSLIDQMARAYNLLTPQ